MPSPIYKVEFDSAGDAPVRGTVLAVYDTNGNGDLVPVGFYQESCEWVSARYLPSGQTYVQYTT